MAAFIACQCEGIPPHDHFMGCAVQDGVYRARYDYDDIGRVWVDWRAVARALMAKASV